MMGKPQPATSPTVGPNVGAGSRTGARGETNDDAYDFFAVERIDLAETVYVALVADGVTGTTGGAQASRIAVQTVKAILQEAPSKQETLSEWLEFAIVRANEEILFAAKQNPQWQGMSTTIVLVAVAGEKLYAMHLGDSRAYLIRGQKIYQLVADHTWTQEAINAGSLTAAEAAHHPGRNHLLRFLGGRKTVGVDRGIIAPDSNRREEYLTTQPGDTILLCTDGVHGGLDDGEIRRIVLEHAGRPQAAVEGLIAAAVAKGQRDDITAVILELPAGRQEPARALVTATAPPPRRSVTPGWRWRWQLLLPALAVLLLLIFLLSSWLPR
jgi:PPM family protein phosphatase